MKKKLLRSFGAIFNFKKTKKLLIIFKLNVIISIVAENKKGAGI